MSAEADDNYAAFSGWMPDMPDNWTIDHDTILMTGQKLQKVKMWPYLDVAHYALSAIAVREDLGSNAIQFAREHPFSCWLSTMMVSFAGTLVANFLLGEPPIAPFQNHFDIIAASVIWYFVFYSPFDVAYKLCKKSPIKLVLSVLKEVQRAHKVSHGVAHARRLYPESYMVQVLVGVSKGAGAGIVKVFEQLARGVWAPTGHEILRPSFTTKACAIAAIVFTLERNTTLISVPHDILYLLVVLFFVYFKMSALLLGVKDPLAPIENLVCSVLMGGIWTAFFRAVETTKEEVTSKQKKNNNDDDFILNNNTNGKKNGARKENKKTK